MKKRVRSSKKVIVDPDSTTQQNETSPKAKKRAPMKKGKTADVVQRSSKKSTSKAAPSAPSVTKKKPQPSPEKVTPLTLPSSGNNPSAPTSSALKYPIGSPNDPLPSPNAAHTTSPTNLELHSTVSFVQHDSALPSLSLDPSASFLLSPVRNSTHTPENSIPRNSRTPSPPPLDSDHLAHFLHTPLDESPAVGENCDDSPTRPSFENLACSPPRTPSQPGLLHVIPKTEAMTSTYEWACVPLPFGFYLTPSLLKTICNSPTHIIRPRTMRRMKTRVYTHSWILTIYSPATLLLLLHTRSHQPSPLKNKLTSTRTRR